MCLRHAESLARLRLLQARRGHENPGDPEPVVPVLSLDAGDARHQLCEVQYLLTDGGQFDAGGLQELAQTATYHQPSEDQQWTRARSS